MLTHILLPLLPVCKGFLPRRRRPADSAGPAAAAPRPSAAGLGFRWKGLRTDGGHGGGRGGRGGPKEGKKADI